MVIASGHGAGPGDWEAPAELALAAWPRASGFSGMTDSALNICSPGSGSILRKPLVTFTPSRLGFPLLRLQRSFPASCTVLSMTEKWLALLGRLAAPPETRHARVSGRAEQHRGVGRQSQQVSGTQWMQEPGDLTWHGPHGGVWRAKNNPGRQATGGSGFSADPEASPWEETVHQALSGGLS